jgi:hypothetical protein
MDFYSYLKSIEVPDREGFATACGTTHARLRQIAYGNEPASPELCVAIDRESGGAVPYASVNDRWLERNGPSDGRKRIPMDWGYVESRAKGGATPTR